MATRRATKRTPSSKTRPMSTNRGERKDAISLLKKDHQLVQDLLQKLESSSGRASRSRDSLLSEIDQELKTHSLIEEEIFYPAFKESVTKKDQQKLYFEAKEEHHLVDVVLGEFEDAEDNDSFSAKCKVLKDLVEHHIEEEEREMFPMAKKAMDLATLKDLGERMEERRQQIESEL